MLPEALKAILSVGVLLIGFVLVLAAAYWASRFMGKRYGALDRGNGYIQVLDRVSLGQDRALWIVKTAGKVLLVGVSPESIQLVSELEESLLEKQPPVKQGELFSEMLKTLRGAGSRKGESEDESERGQN